MHPNLRREDMRPERSLGEGVYLEEHLPSGRYFVAKKPFGDKKAEQIAREFEYLQTVHAFYRDQVAQTNDSTVWAPGIIPIAGFDPSWSILWTPYLSQHTVHDSIKHTDSVQIVVQRLIEAADALGLIHRANLAHRDVKNENFLDLARPSKSSKVLPYTGGSICVFDLGNACTRDYFQSKFSGTPEMASPQQLTCQPDRRADVFGLAAAGYEQFTGEVPYPLPDEYMPQAMWNNARARLIRETPLTVNLLEQYEGKVPDLTIDVIVQGLSFNPETRGSLLEFRNNLAYSVGLPETTGWLKR